MGKISQISFSRYLRDNEFVTMCQGLVAVFDDAYHSIECLTYDEVLSRFKMEVEIMDAIMPRERAHALTHSILLTSTLRQEAVQGLVYVVKAAAKSTDMKKREAARIFMAWFSKYRHNLVSTTQDVVTRAVEQLSKDMAADSGIGDAISTMDISAQILEVIDISPEVSSLRHDRVMDLARRKQTYVDNAAIRQEVVEALKTLLFYVETQMKLHGRDVADLLELAIKEVLNRSRFILKTRRTKSANKRAAANDDKPSRMPSGDNSILSLNDYLHSPENNEEEDALVYEDGDVIDSDGSIEHNSPADAYDEDEYDSGIAI